MRVPAVGDAPTQRLRQFAGGFRTEPDSLDHFNAGRFFLELSSQRLEGNSGCVVRRKALHDHRESVGESGERAFLQLRLRFDLTTCLRSTHKAGDEISAVDCGYILGQQGLQSPVLYQFRRWPSHRSSFGVSPLWPNIGQSSGRESETRDRARKPRTSATFQCW